MPSISCINFIIKISDAFFLHKKIFATTAAYAFLLLRIEVSLHSYIFLMILFFILAPITFIKNMTALGLEFLIME